MPVRLRAGATLLLLAMISCGDDASKESPAPVGDLSLYGTQMYQGGEVQVSGQDLEEFGEGARILLGDTVDLVRVDDTTMSAVVPDSVHGFVEVKVILNEGTEISFGPSVVYGYTGETRQPFTMYEDIYIYPRGGSARLMGGGAPAGTTTQLLSIIDLDNGDRDSWPILDLNQLRGPGPTTTPGVFLTRTEGDMLRAWQLYPTLTLIDSFPGRLPTRQVAQFSDSVWFTSYNHSFNVSGSSGGTTQAEETEGIHISPSFDRATIQVDGMGDADLPVFDVPSGAVAYRLPLRESASVYFTDDGVELAVAGATVNNGPDSRILLVRSSDGTVLGDTTITGKAFAVGLDARRPVLYIGALQPNGRPELVVLDKATFRVIARFRVPPSGLACSFGCYKGVVATSVTGAVYLAWSLNIDGTHAYRFQLPGAF